MNLADEFESILKNRNVTSLFQPIVRLRDGEVLGYEALSRGPKDSPLYSPIKLLNIAHEQNRLWELEQLFRISAIEKASILKLDKLLFLNVDPDVINDDSFKKGFTMNFLEKHNLPPDSIIFEITERTAIKDYKKFNEILNYYTNQGYKIAIDDVGAGYSGLKTISKTKPNYLKIDMELIRDIDKDSFKQAIIKAFVDTAMSTNIKLIAEGIETKEELKTLINLGVYGGQGYLLKKPSENITDIPKEIKNLIINYNKITSNVFKYSANYHYIGTIMEEAKAFSPDTPCKVIKEYFDNSDVEGACLIENNKPVGLIMKNHLNSVLAKQYGFAVYSKRPVSLIMDDAPLVVDYYTPINIVSEAAMDRSNDKVYDNIIVTKGAKYSGIVSIRKLLLYTTTAEKNYARELNPLTSLPGNSIINRVLNDTISLNKPTCILYLDLDNFKAYNDVYGFDNGDKIIQLTAEIIKTQAKSMFPYNSFVGHVGGDDFVCLIDAPLKECELFCKNVISEFDEKILNFFNKKDRLNGYIKSEDRNGNVYVYNLTSVSIAVLYGLVNKFAAPSELAQYMSSIKKEAKKEKYSNYVIKEIY
ncbi:EAL domain/GGDEF domain protein [Caldisalinibacter kiritimatiensis]|uniref:EAL domain/GGDEF domain protein n=1 Tax=Caldisalinibacter kiritimatiensis TaxID=1304284 RepID=R1CFU1_9FIRM|nr:EAL domain/GGDEF domain protein [Caldisalinibacter kiritimatiensis]